MQYRRYTSDRNVRLTNGEHSTVLKKHSLFKLDVFKDRPVVVIDGIRYPIQSKYVKELKARSELVKPDKGFAAQDQAFDKLGHTLLKYFTYWGDKLSNGNATSAFKNGTVFSRFPVRAPSGEVVCVLGATSDQLFARIYKPTTLNIEGWDFVPTLWQALAKIANKMMSKDGLRVGKPTIRTAHVGNVGTPWGEPFSGTILYKAAKWGEE